MFFQAFVLCFLFFISIARSETVVNVALTSIQPPLVINERAQLGLIYDVIKLLNESQSDFRFETKLVPPQRVLNYYRDINVHIVAYNDVLWGWKQRGGQASLNLTNGRDLFFSLKGEGVRTALKEIGAVRGFHYAFADFDAEKLASMDNVSLVSSEENVLRLVERERVEKGIVSETFLDWTAKVRPELYERLKIDEDDPDHSYNRQFVVFDFSPIDVMRLNQLLINLYEMGDLQRVYAWYGLEVPAMRE